MKDKTFHTLAWDVIAALAILVLVTSCRMASPALEGGQTIAPVIESAESVQSPAQSGLFNINWQYTPHVVGGAAALAVVAFVMWRVVRAMKCIVLAVLNRNGKKPTMFRNKTGRYVRRGAPNKG